MRRAKNPARSLGGTCRAKSSPTTPETLMYRASWALNQRTSYLHQAPRSPDGKERKIMNMKTDLDNSILRMNSPLFWFTLVIPIAIIGLGVNFILDPVGAST